MNIRALTLGMSFMMAACGSAHVPTSPTTGVTQQPVTQQPVPVAPVAKLVVQIDRSGSTGAILGYSPILFDASVSQGERLTYDFDFGDGSTASGTANSMTHPCRTAGLLTTRLTVRDELGRSSTAISRFPCVSLLNAAVYGWIHSFENPRNRRYEFRRLGFASQTGATLTGSYTHPEGNSSRFSASLSGDRTLTITLDDRTITFTGDVLLNDEYSETSYFQNRRLRLFMRGGSADGETLLFNQYDPY